MLIDYKKFPGLKALETKNLAGIKVLKHEEFPLPFLQGYWEKYCGHFKQQIYHLSEKFVRDAEESVFNLSENQDAKGFGKISGTYLFNEYTQCFYFDEDSQEYAMFSFAGNYLEALFIKTKDSDEVFAYDVQHQVTNVLEACLDRFFQYICMLRYILAMNIDTITVEPTQTTGGSRAEKLKNSTGSKIHFIDSRWNNDIINPNPFPVKGHYRMQRFGKNREHVREIFIVAFLKKGYKLNAGLRSAAARH
jgi:hypothetical protein